MVRCLKSHLRSTLGGERLASLVLMTMHYDSCRQLETETIVQCFVQAHPRKLLCNLTNLLYFNTHFIDNYYESLSH